MIDEGWHGRYGEWEFDRAKFPAPKAMVDELHTLGFKVMLWVVPNVCPDEGEWIADDGKVYTEGEYMISAPIDRLIYFKKL